MKLLFALFALIATAAFAAPSACPIFPAPRGWAPAAAGLPLSATTPIVVSATPSASDLHAALILSAEMADTFGVGVPIVRAATPPAGPCIVLGDTNSSLVRAAFALRKLAVPTETAAHAEGYTLLSDANGAILAGADEAGTFYAVQSARQLIRRTGANAAELAGATVSDWPATGFRGVRVFLPGRDNLPFFRRWLVDFVALHKFNKLVLELNAAMRFERHPELNAGWLDYNRSLNLSRRDRPKGPNGEGQDSSHHDTADGGILEKSEVADLVRLCEQHHIEVVPEIPTLTHSYYLLTRHKELAEITNAEWPDAYCPLAPGVYDLVFDVLDEIIEVTHPKLIHIGHDEWRMPIDACPRCRGHDYGELFFADIRKIHGFLTQRGIKVGVWGDHFIPKLHLNDERKNAAGKVYRIPGLFPEAQILAGLPKDILIGNWFWRDERGGVDNDAMIARWGYPQVLANLTAEITDGARRRGQNNMIGGSVSLWSATTEWNFAKENLNMFSGTAELLWSEKLSTPDELILSLQARMPDIRRRLSGQRPPAALGDPQRRVAVAEAGAVVPIGEDPTSLTFVHSLAQPAGNRIVHQTIFNPIETSELLGAYEVAYEDGLVQSVEIRYGWNIIECAWPAVKQQLDKNRNQPLNCYAADPVSGPEGTSFAFEWTNPRPGKKIVSVRLRQLGKPANPVLLHEVRVTATRPRPVNDR